MCGHTQAFILSLLCAALDHSHFVAPIPMCKTANRCPLQFIFIFTTFHLLVRRVNDVQKVLRLRRRRGARSRERRRPRWVSTGRRRIRNQSPQSADFIIHSLKLFPHTLKHSPLFCCISFKLSNLFNVTSLLLPQSVFEIGPFPRATALVPWWEAPPSSHTWRSPLQT